MPKNTLRVELELDFIELKIHLVGLLFRFDIITVNSWNKLDKTLSREWFAAIE
jgi:hypothetical protein